MGAIAKEEPSAYYGQYAGIVEVLRRDIHEVGCYQGDSGIDTGGGRQPTVYGINDTRDHQPDEGTHEGYQEKAESSFPQNELPGKDRDQGKTEYDQAGGVIYQALSFQYRDDPFGDLQGLQHAGSGYGIRGRNDPSQQESQGQGEIRDHKVGRKSHRSGRKDHQTERQHTNGPFEYPEVMPGS